MRSVTCDPNTLRCQIERIANELSAFDLEGVLATFAATLVGAGLAGLAAWLVFRGESNERYEQGLTDAVEALSTAMTRTARDFVAWKARLIEHFAAQETAQKPSEAPEEPDRVALDVGLDMLIARARKDDRVIAIQIREVAYQLSFVEDAKWANAEYATLRRVIVAWRAGRRSDKVTRANLAIVNERRKLKKANPAIKPENLPKAPETHEAPVIG